MASAPNETAGPSATKPAGTMSAAQAIVSVPSGMVVIGSAAIDAPARSSVSVTVIGAPCASVPDAPEALPHVIVVL